VISVGHATGCTEFLTVRILLISQYFWPESFRINDVVALLQDEGCEVTVLTGQPNYPGGTIFPGYRAGAMGRDGRTPDYEILRVPLVTRGKGGAVRLAANYLSFVLTASLFGPWLLRGRRFDVIFVYGVSPILQALPAILLRRLKRAPLVLWVQDLWPQSLEVTGYVRNRTVLGLVGRLTAWIYQHCDLVLGQSQAFVRTITPMAGGVPVEMFPTPGDIDRGAGPAEPPVVLPEGFNVVFAGNLGTAQALPTILDAAQMLRERAYVRFVFVGDGSQKSWLEKEIHSRNLPNVALLGRFAPEAMPGILVQASVLLATLGKSDILARTIPAKVSTYLKAARPIIAAIDGEGGDVVVASGAGIACPAEDAAALAEAVIQLADTTPERRAQMGAAGRAYYERTFEPTMLTKRLLAIFRVVIDAKSTAKTRQTAS
jgi:glycosyltransferase involved in cell wall biosynthesis